MLKLLYLLVGVSLAQTIAEFNTLVREYVDYLKATRESIAKYRPNPALLKGTPEAARAIAEHQHGQRVQPNLEKLTKRIRRVRTIPVLVYASLTVGLFCTILYLEANAETNSDARQRRTVPAMQDTSRQGTENGDGKRDRSNIPDSLAAHN